MSKNEQLNDMLKFVYQLFNKREVNRLLDFTSKNINWENSITGENIHGYDNFLNYLIQQQNTNSLYFEPIAFVDNDDNTITVKVKQIIKDSEDNILSESIVHHRYKIEESIIQSMKIQ